MQIECKIDDNNKNLVQVSVIKNDLVYKVDCQQVNLCEKLPSLVQTLEQYITMHQQTLHNADNIIINIDNTKNITTKRILISFFNGFFINNTTIVKTNSLS